MRAGSRPPRWPSQIILWAATFVQRRQQPWVFLEAGWRRPAGGSSGVGGCDDLGVVVAAAPDDSQTFGFARLQQRTAGMKPASSGDHSRIGDLAFEDLFF